MEQTKETVNHPSHYNSGKIEVIEAIEDWGFGEGFNLGNAIKYIARANHKGNHIEDLKKAVWYVSREIARLDKLNSKNTDALKEVESALATRICSNQTSVSEVLSSAETTIREYIVAVTEDDKETTTNQIPR